MALIVEDGTGLPDSNSYGSIQEFRDYHLLRGNDVSAFTDEQVTVGLFNATEYIDYRFRYKGERLRYVQALEWPRVDVIYKDLRNALPLPKEVKYATFEYALVVVNSGKGSQALAPDSVYDDQNRIVSSKSEKVGSVSISTTYEAGSGGGFRKYTLADRFLSQFKENRLLRV